MVLSVTLRSTEASTESLVKSVSNILDSTRLLSLSTISEDGGPAVCHAYFAYDSECRLYILTPPSTAHIGNISRDARVAVAVADTQQTGDGGKQGIQINGSARRALGEELALGLAAYRERFPATRAALSSEVSLNESGWESRIYVIEPKVIKVFDEKNFGQECWIEAAVDRE